MASFDFIQFNMTRKSSRKPYDKPSQSKSINESASSSKDASDTTQKVSSSKEKFPSLDQFDKLVNTVNELSVLVKSLKQNDNDTSVVQSGNSNVNPPDMGQCTNATVGMDIESMVNRNIESLRPVRPSVQVEIDNSVNRPSVTFEVDKTNVRPVNVSGEQSNVLAGTSSMLSGNVIQDNTGLQSVTVGNNPIPINATRDVGNGDLLNIQDSVNSHLSSLMGQDILCDAGNYTPNDLPIDIKVTDKLKSLIWSNQYIDLALLLDSDFIEEFVPNNKFELVGQLGESLMVAPKKAAKSIVNLGQWCSAFSVYIDVYCQKYPNELSAMFTYMNTIKKLAHRNGNYIMYDREFRFMRQRQNMPWNITHSGLWLECRDPLNALKPNRNQKNKSSSAGKPYQNNQGAKKSNHPTSYCFRFHTYGRCGRNSCNYKHYCYHPLCSNDEHPICRCPNANKQDSNSNSKQNSSNKAK